MVANHTDLEKLLYHFQEKLKFYLGNFYFYFLSINTCEWTHLNHYFFIFLKLLFTLCHPKKSFRNEKMFIDGLSHSMYVINRCRQIIIIITIIDPLFFLGFKHSTFKNIQYMCICITGLTLKHLLEQLKNCMNKWSKFSP